MSNEDYGFFFEKQGLSGYEGPIDPSQQYFEGSHADHAVVRETGQNTLDNPGKYANGRIRMEFELATMATNEIPGIENLRIHLDAVADQTKGQEGHERMVRAATLAKEETISVLRISDFNTTGLTGSESVDSIDSPLSRLTRGKGGSTDDERGGSFGIGSAVGPMASDLCTVIYTSLPEGSKNTVLAGYTRLATHTVNDVAYRPEGYFTDLNRDDEFSYKRPAPKIGPFSERTVPGTDIYILGYRMVDKDPELERVREAMIDNFMVAIARGNLVIEGIAKGNHWTLDGETLAGFCKGRLEAQAFYDALQDAAPATSELRNVGKVKLYINIDDRLERKLHTITMRAPLMKIDTFKHNSVSAKYAAVLICDSPEGNKYLRKLEPPQHHVWDAARDPLSGNQVVRELKTFVREALRERVGSQIGDEVKIEGLSRFLPTDNSDIATTGQSAVPSSELETDGSEKESSTVTGGEVTQEPAVVPPGKKVRVKVRRQASGGGDEEIEQGKQRGGVRKRKGKGTGLPGSGTEGDGDSRIRGRELNFRSWNTQSDIEETSLLTLSIAAKEDEEGDLELVGLGPGGNPEVGYELPISRVVQHASGLTKEIKFSGNTLKNLALKGGQKTRIDVYLPAGERFRVGVV